MTATLLVVFGVFAAAAVAATLTFVWLDRLDERKHEPKHAHPPGGRHAFADPRDATDPDGEQYAAELHQDWWRDPAPAPVVPTGLVASGRLPMLTREQLEEVEARFAEKFERDAKRNDPTSPAADTGEINIAVAEWGMTAQAKADELAARYLTAEVAQ